MVPKPRPLVSDQERPAGLLLASRCLNRALARGFPKHDRDLCMNQNFTARRASPRVKNSVRPTHWLRISCSSLAEPFFAPDAKAFMHDAKAFGARALGQGRRHGGPKRRERNCGRPRHVRVLCGNRVA